MTRIFLKRNTTETKTSRKRRTGKGKTPEGEKKNVCKTLLGRYKCFAFRVAPLQNETAGTVFNFTAIAKILTGANGDHTQRVF